MKDCPECGLPLVECNALAVARREAESYLRMNDYRPSDARHAAERLVPHPKK